MSTWTPTKLLGIKCLWLACMCMWHSIETVRRRDHRFWPDHTIQIGGCRVWWKRQPSNDHHTNDQGESQQVEWLRHGRFRQLSYFRIGACLSLYLMNYSARTRLHTWTIIYSYKHAPIYICMDMDISIGIWVTRHNKRTEWLWSMLIDRGRSFSLSMLRPYAIHWQEVRVNPWIESSSYSEISYWVGVYVCVCVCKYMWGSLSLGIHQTNWSTRNHIKHKHIYWYDLYLALFLLN